MQGEHLFHVVLCAMWASSLCQDCSLARWHLDVCLQQVVHVQVTCLHAAGRTKAAIPGALCSSSAVRDTCPGLLAGAVLWDQGSVWRAGGYHRYVTVDQSLLVDQSVGGLTSLQPAQLPQRHRLQCLPGAAASQEQGLCAWQAQVVGYGRLWPVVVFSKMLCSLSAREQCPAVSAGRQLPFMVWVRT
jgi:hypothetical protein